MIEYWKKTDLWTRLRWALGALLLFFVAARGPIYGRDTLDYLSAGIIRPPLTPITFSLLQFLFGKGYAQAFAVLQTLSVLLACSYFSSALRRTANAGAPFRLAIFLLAASPLLTNSIGNWLLTEGISYSLFLVSASLLLRLQEDFTPGTLLLLAASISVNILNRSQMVFLWGIYSPAVLLLSLRAARRAGRSCWLTAALLWALLPWAGTELMQRSWNLARHGYFAPSDFPGKVQLASSLLYVSSRQDLDLFRDKPYFPAMRQIYTEMDEYKLFAEYRHDFDMNYAAYLDSGIRPQGIYNRFSCRSDVLYAHTLVRVLYNFATAQDIDRESWKSAKPIDYSNSAAWVGIEATANDVTRTLAPKVWREYLKLVGSRIKNKVSMEGLLLMAILAALPFAWPGAAQNFMSGTVAAAWLNMLAVAICTGLYPRITFYTDTLLAVSACLLLWLLAARRNSNGTAWDTARD